MAVDHAPLKSIRNTCIFSLENFSRLTEIMYEYKVAENSYLFWEGDKADKLYYIKHGRVKVTKATDDGKQLILYMFQDGDMFGQFDGIAQNQHTFNAEVIEEGTIGVIQIKDLEVLLWQHGDLAVEFMKWLGHMHHITQTKFRDLLMFGKPGALSSTLIRLNNTFGKPYGQYSMIAKKLTNTELAELIGATRESVNRMLSDLKKVGIIGLENGYIILKDINSLREMCQCENCPSSLCRI
ncbi:MAG TPA: Crp/Fnr family transcriptional regulator [Bacilli bacterium]